jgi:hypothetical protein
MWWYDTRLLVVESAHLTKHSNIVAAQIRELCIKRDCKLLDEWVQERCDINGFYQNYVQIDWCYKIILLEVLFIFVNIACKYYSPQMSSHELRTK